MADHALQPYYNALAPREDAEYGSVLPVGWNRKGSPAYEREGANFRPALPGSMREGLVGILDLLKSTETGSLTGNALSAITLGPLGVGGALAPRNALASGGAKIGGREGMPSLQSVTSAWDQAGIKHALHERNDGMIILSKIVVPEDARNQGIGTKAMQDLIAYADATGKRIALSPSADFGGNKGRLEDFYKSFGFVNNKGRSRDFSISETMLRDPTPKGPVY
jgi:GNAT superfamily N-acetyltransferase